MDPVDRIDFLAQWLAPGSIGAEVGVWKGDFSSVVLERVGPARLFLVDPWEFQPDFPSAWYGGGRALDQAYMDAVHDEVRERFHDEIAAGQVDIVRSRSDDAAAPVELDWVYIDGNHTYEAVRSDIEHWHRQVKDGGYVVLDDYGIPGWWDDGVTRAVSQALESGDLELVAVGGSQAVLQVLSRD